ncbi:hypothetical protein D1007_57544 [Hordeum vulgare]|nr:hypothetical protein D1007_57544 [Hordeum vulgare]
MEVVGGHRLPSRAIFHAGSNPRTLPARLVREVPQPNPSEPPLSTWFSALESQLEDSAQKTRPSPPPLAECTARLLLLKMPPPDASTPRRQCAPTAYPGSFVTPILYAYGTIPTHAGPCALLQIFSIKVMENEEWKIRWPVEVYGFIAARDTVDHNRNLLFSRTRDDPQILTQQDSFLKLTGPCRPIALIDPVDFEIQLKVKGTTESEDETLMARWFEYSHGFGEYGELACRRRWDGNFCTLEITSALLARTVVATIISADIIEGSWPDGYRGRVVARTAAIDEDILLLDSGEGPLKVDPDGRVTLQRGVVCVEHQGMLTVSMEAYSKADICYADCVEFRPKKSLTSIGICDLGFCTVRFIVGWSPMATKSDLMYFGN